jgi:hypothetical protein
MKFNITAPSYLPALKIVATLVKMGKFVESGVKIPQSKLAEYTINGVQK